jgi:hypothetical protein
MILPGGKLQSQSGSLAILICYSIALLLLASRTLSEVE